MRYRVGLVAVLLVLAGCASGMGPPSSSPASPTPEWTGDADNHFQQETLTVAINATANEDRDFRPMLRAALDYWEANAEQYAGFPIEYEIVDGEADVEVRFVEAIENCGAESYTAGCAPIIENAGQVRQPVVVRVRSNYSANSTTQVLEHEFGHTLGLHHDDEPRSVMQHRAELTTLPKPDATTKAMPWGDPELSVYVDYANVSRRERDETERQVAGALGYFVDGADGTVPDNVSFTRTDNRTAADVVVVFGETAPCTSGGGSCGSIRGRDPDGDGALETYTRMRIVVAGVDTEARGWHVGYWLARGFGLSDDELPEPLATDDPAVRRSDWWA